MRSNFTILSKKWRELYEVTRQAEKAVQIDPNSALIKLRLFGELVANKYLLMKVYMSPIE